MIHRALGRDKPSFLRELQQLQKHAQKSRPGEKFQTRLENLEKKIKASIEAKKNRFRRLPKISIPENLPISEREKDIVDAIQKHPVIIIAGDTGSGKSTQIPKMCLSAGRGIEGKIACTQPRRIAATTISARIAEELGETVGQSVGYKIRFKDRTSKTGYIKILTDGMLLAETQADPLLLEYDTLIVDEAHERSLNIDFILGILKNLLQKRPDLKLIITSATIDTEKFSKGFANAPVIRVSGRTYPVSLQYRPIDPDLEDKGDMTYVDMAVKTAKDIHGQGGFGDILIFMPTEQDILETCQRLEGEGLKNARILPLFARLPGASQRRVFASGKGRKIIVSTNVAETSLTIPGIKYVVDTGLARILRYLPRTRTTSLPISPISQSSADQRKGRCGRMENGVCIRLYSQEDYETRPEFTEPEILRSNLAEVILRMIALKLGDIQSFPFLDPPGAGSIKDGFDLLVELGAIFRKNGQPVLTPMGRMMSRIPIDPRISRMLIEAGTHGCIEDVAVIAAALSIQDPRERPIEKATQADQAHNQFKDAASDFITLLNIWNRYHRSWETLGTQNKMRKFCKAHFLSYPRMREWDQIHEQITTLLKTHRMGNKKQKPHKLEKDRYAAIHKSVLSGYLSNIALKREKNMYTAARGREVMLFPGSTLFNKGPDWIVAVEMVKTTRLFARTVAKIDPVWLEPLGGSLCKRTYSNPHWEMKAGQVRALEQVSLYGLIIVSNRPVAYGPIDPAESHKIFIQSALVHGETQKKFLFLSHNQRLIDKVTRLEAKVRRRGILVEEAALEAFYSERLPRVCDIRTLEKVIRERGNDDFLKMRDADIVDHLPDREEIDLYPDQMETGKGSLPISYKFNPGKGDDGVTLKVPVSRTSELSPQHLDWMVPGLFREKMTALIKGLPKKYRKQLVPVSNTVDIVLGEMKKSERPLITILAEFIYERFGVDIPAKAWADTAIPEHLQMRISIRDHRGRELEAARDASVLRDSGLSRNRSHEEDTAVWKNARSQWEKTNITAWDVNDLPESLSLSPKLSAFPGFFAHENSVDLRLYRDHNEAIQNHRKGVMRLYLIRFKKEVRFLKKDLKIPSAIAAKTMDFGGPKALESAMLTHLLNHFFHLNIRSKATFEKTALDAAKSLFSKAGEMKKQVEAIVSAYHHTMKQMHALTAKNPPGSPVSQLLNRLMEETGALLPPDFMERYDGDNLPHLPRYLKAIEIRAERGTYDSGRDREKNKSVEPFETALEKMLPLINSSASPEKRQAIKDFFWMLQEYKVSIFAQELKTAIPVSAKRMNKKQREIERMV